MNFNLFVGWVFLIFLVGCSLPDPEEAAIEELLKAFVASIDNGDEFLGKACLLDVSGFNLLNPDIGSRADYEVITEVALAELLHNYHAIVDNYSGKDVAFIEMTIGGLWTQHKGRRAFVDNMIKIEVDGTASELPIRGIAKIDNEWKIVELSTVLDTE